MVEFNPKKANKNPDTIVIDNLAGIIDLEQEGAVLDIFGYHANKSKKDKESSPNQYLRIDIGTGYFFLSGFKEAYSIFKFMYENGLLKKVENPNWGTKAPIRVVMGRETDQQTRDLLISIVKDQLNTYDDEKIDFLKKLIDERLIEFRVFEDRKFHVKIYNFYFSGVDSYPEPLDIYAGSANFTASGLKSNIEICLPFRGSSASRELFRDWFTSVWNSSNPDLNVLEAIDDVAEAEYVLLESELFFAKLINILKKRYLFPSRVGIKLDILLEFQNLSYYIVMERLQKYGGYILANSVGLGKSYVACQAMTEYLINYPDRKCLLIYPPRIKEEWGDYLKEFKIGDRVDAVSMGILQKTPFDKAKDDFFFDYRTYAEKYSLIIVDEAHNFRNPCNRSANLKEIIKANPKADVLLVSATPINLGASDLINIIDLFYVGERQRKFEMSGLKEIFDRTKKLIMKQRMTKLDKVTLESLKRIELELSLKITWRIVQEYFNEDLKKLSGKDVKYEEPVTNEIRFNYPSSYKTEIFYEIVNFLSSLNYEPAKMWDGEGYKEDKNLLFWYKWQLYKRLESSLYAFYKSIDNMYKRFVVYGASMIKEEIIDSTSLKELPIKLDKKHFDDLMDLERVETVVLTFKGLEKTQKEEILGRIDEDIKYTEEMLKKLKFLFGRLDEDGNLEKYPIEGDKKIDELKTILQKNMREGKPTIVFSQYRDTINYLYNILVNDFRKIDFIHGGTRKSKNKIIKDFQEGEIDIILTTDVLSEGVNIPRADHIINFDLPYNPTILIQRAGRALRITNPKKIFVHNFRPEADIDKELELYDKLDVRLDIILSITGLDFIIWLMDEKKIESIYEKEKRQYLEHYSEYRDKIATSNPDDLVRTTVPQESKLDKVLREAILKFGITPEFCDNITETIKKPIYTILRGNEGLCLVGEMGSRKLFMNEIQESLEPIKSSDATLMKISERDKDHIKKLMEDKKIEIIREETSKGATNKKEEKLIRKISKLKERFQNSNNVKILESIKSHIQSHSYTLHELGKIDDLCNTIEKIPEFVINVDDKVTSRTIWGDIIPLSMKELTPKELKLLAFIKYLEGGGKYD